MTSNKKTARIAGVLYLALILLGIFSLAYVPSKLIVWDDAATTVGNIMASQPLFRLGIVSGIACYTVFLFLPLVLYKLLKQVDTTMATLMVILAVVSVPISLLNIQAKLDVLSLLSGASYLIPIETEQMQAQVMLALSSYNNGLRIVQVFWGLWLFPFGYLVFKSRFLPKILGIFLMAGCFGYLINFFGYSLLPNYREIGISTLIGLPATIGEFGACLWLLIMGAKEMPVVSKDE